MYWVSVLHNPQYMYLKASKEILGQHANSGPCLELLASSFGACDAEMACRVISLAGLLVSPKNEHKQPFQIILFVKAMVLIKWIALNWQHY